MDLQEYYNRFKCSREFNRLKEDIIKGNIPAPTKATIELTMRCNLNCQMCFRDAGQKEELDTEQVKAVIENLPPSIEELHLIGGEVFLRSDIFEILDYLSEKGYRVRVHTNGTLIDDEKIERLSGYKNILGMGFSIDGKRELHNRIRGSGQAFDKTIEAIKKTVKILPVSVNTVLLDENFEQVEDIFQIIKDLGVRQYRLEPEMFCTQEEVQLSDADPITANIKEKGTYGYTAKDMMHLKKRLDRLSNGTGIQIVIAPRVAEIDAEEFISGEIREKKKLFCKHLLVPRIDSGGHLVFCHIIKKRFGRLLESDLGLLWNSGELNEFRKTLLSNNLLPVCKRCCRLRSI